MIMNDIKDLIRQGESYKIEFKEKLDKSFIEEVVAFANASGGMLILGVADDGVIKGVDTSNSSRSRIQDTIKHIKPSVVAEIEIIDEVIIIHVAEGKDKHYACSKGFYLRMGANSQKLERDEILEFFQSEGKIRFDEVLQRKIDAEVLFDSDAYKRFLRLSGISDVIDKEDVLSNLDCGVMEEKFIFNNAGLLFFSKEPMKYIKHASVICALYKGLDKVTILDKKDLQGNLIDVIEDSVLFLKRHLNVRYEIKETRRKEILDIPEVAIREAIINAICHRDYFEKGAQVMIEIFDDRVVISNPGGLPKGLEPKNFGKVSMARNPVIASLLQRSDYIEKMGTGIRRMYNVMKEAGLPEPEFDMDGFFIVTLKRESYLSNHNNLADYSVGENVGESVGESIREKYDSLNELQIEIIKSLKKNSQISAKKLESN